MTKKDARNDRLRTALLALLKERRHIGVATLEMQAKKANVALDDAEALVEQLVREEQAAAGALSAGTRYWYAPSKGDPFAQARAELEKDPDPPAELQAEPLAPKAPAPEAPPPAPEAPRDRPHLILTRPPEVVSLAPQQERSRGGKANKPASAAESLAPAAPAPAAPTEIPAAPVAEENPGDPAEEPKTPPAAASPLASEPVEPVNPWLREAESLAKERNSLRHKLWEAESKIETLEEQIRDWDRRYREADQASARDLTQTQARGNQLRVELGDLKAEAEIYHEAICRAVPEVRGTSPAHMAGALDMLIYDLRAQGKASEKGPAEAQEPASTEAPAESEVRAIDESEGGEASAEALDPETLVDELLSWAPGHLAWLAQAHHRFVELDGRTEDNPERQARLHQERDRWRADILRVVGALLRAPRGPLPLPPIHVILSTPLSVALAPQPAPAPTAPPGQEPAPQALPSPAPPPLVKGARLPCRGTLEAQVFEQLDLAKGKRAGEIAKRLKSHSPSVAACLSKLVRAGVAARLDEGLYVRRSA